MTEDRLLNAPLTTVICEVRYDAEPLGQAIDLAELLGPHGLTEYAPEDGLHVSMVPGQFSQSTVRRHRFSDRDGSRALTIDDKTCSYETADYRGIDDFLTSWQPVVAAVKDVIGFRARTRIGLRYVNQVPLASAGREAVAKAVNEVLLPPWGAHELLANLTGSLQELRFEQLEGELAVRHGLQRPAPSAPPVYMLDYDHYEQRLRSFDVQEEGERLRQFNATVYDVFRWSLTDEQYADFKPEPRP